MYHEPRSLRDTVDVMNLVLAVDGINVLPEELVHHVFRILLASSELEMEAKDREISRRALVSFASSSRAMRSTFLSLLRENGISEADVLTSVQVGCGVCKSMHCNMALIAATSLAFDRLLSVRLSAVCGCYLLSCLSQLTQSCPRLKSLSFVDGGAVQEAERSALMPMLQRFLFLAHLCINEPSFRTLAALTQLPSHIRQLHLSRISHSDLHYVLRYLAKNDSLRDFRYEEENTSELQRCHLSFVKQPNHHESSDDSQSHVEIEKNVSFVPRVAGHLLFYMKAKSLHIKHGEKVCRSLTPHCLLCDGNSVRGRLDWYRQILFEDGVEELYRVEFLTPKSPHDQDFFRRIQPSFRSNLHCIVSVDKNILLMPPPMADVDSRHEATVVSVSSIVSAHLFDAIHPLRVVLKQADYNRVSIVETTLLPVGERGSLRVGEPCMRKWNHPITQWLKTSSSTIRGLSLKLGNAIMPNDECIPVSSIDRLLHAMPQLRWLDTCVELLTHADAFYTNGLLDFLRMVPRVHTLHIRKSITYFHSDRVVAESRLFYILPILLSSMLHEGRCLRMVALHGPQIRNIRKQFSLQIRGTAEALADFCIKRPGVDVASLQTEVSNWIQQCPQSPA